MKLSKASLFAAILMVIIVVILAIMIFTSDSLSVNTALIIGGLVVLLFAVVYAFIALRVEKQ